MELIVDQAVSMMQRHALNLQLVVEKLWGMEYESDVMPFAD
jgi:hypothetical protein